MKELDVRGLSCPEPLMHVKDELASGEKNFVVLTDEAHTRRNIETYLQENKINFETREEGSHFSIEVRK